MGNVILAGVARLVLNQVPEAVVDAMANRNTLAPVLFSVLASPLCHGQGGTANPVQRKQVVPLLDLGSSCPGRVLLKLLTVVAHDFPLCDAEGLVQLGKLVPQVCVPSPGGEVCEAPIAFGKEALDISWRKRGRSWSLIVRSHSSLSLL